MARRGYVQLVFQSTLPLRGATAYRFSIDETLIISIHTPLAGSDIFVLNKEGVLTYFNPHSPCGERLDETNCGLFVGDFNPHSPCGERPIVPQKLYHVVRISIHTPLAGSDRRNETFLTK